MSPDFNKYKGFKIYGKKTCTEFNQELDAWAELVRPAVMFSAMYLWILFFAVKKKKKMLFLMETAKKWSNFANFVLDIPCLRKEHGIAIQ